ncbi:MAG TPA: YegS/Rv2252/BmrU family lipid kinase [Chloroflexia bacterium]|nr:YegS/Rv2252/BmrU family lipid kinase [Chloroflexia bacterium]
MISEIRAQAGTAYRPLIILNPGANRGRTSSLAATIRGILQDLGSDAEVAATWDVADGRRAVQAAAQDGRRPIVACGGDGTIHATASSLLDIGAPVPLGIVAAGSGNDYAGPTLHLPRDLRAALEVALYGRPQAMDVARLNDGWLINSFGTGIDANVAWDVRDMVESGRTRVRGQALYTVSAIKQILRYYHRLPALAITVDGRHWGTRRMLLAAVMIGPTAGGGYRLTPQADPRDGRLDILLARRMPQAKAFLALPLAKTGYHTWLREVQIVRGREVTIESAELVHAHADGELVSARTFAIHIVPGGLTVMVPR